MKTTSFIIENMTCSSCSVRIQNQLNNKEGVSSANVNFANNRANITYDENIVSEKEIEGIIDGMGYKILVKNNDSIETKKYGLKIIFIFSLVFSFPIMLFSMGPMVGISFVNIDSNINFMLQLILTSIVIIINKNLYLSGIKKLIKGSANMESLIVIGTLSAYIYGIVMGVVGFINNININHHLYFESAAFILVFISLGKYLEEKTKGKTSQAIKKLLELQPNSAIVIKNGIEIETKINLITKGDLILVKPGDRIPIDGIIQFGISTIDESSVTGESIPVTKTIGDEVIGGTINKTSIIKIQVTKNQEETMISQIVKFIENATNSKAPIQIMADRISYYFVPIVIVTSIISFSIWYLLGYGFEFSLKIFISILVIACPCALGLATPTAIMMGTGVAAKNGILIKDSETLEKAKKINLIVFDKTGTLTKGKPEVISVKAIGINNEELLKIAFSLSKKSKHPLSKSIQEYYKSKDKNMLEIIDFIEIEGKGLVGLNYKTLSKYLIGNIKLLEQENIEIEKDSIEYANTISLLGQTPLFIAQDNNIIGILGIMDEIKSDAIDTIKRLKNMGIKIAMVSGDNKTVSKIIGNRIGIDDIYSEIYPKQKAEIVKELQRKHGIVAMVGDGINDAPALIQSDVGIAIGTGTDIAIESSNIILINNKLFDIIKAIKISSYTSNKINQNLFWAFLYNLLGIPIAAGILYPIFGYLLNPIIAAIAMSMSSISVLTNSLLMKYFKFE